MTPGASLASVGAAAVVDCEALEQALRSGTSSTAAHVPATGH